MIAYNQDQLDNVGINEEAEKAFKKQYITAEELAQVKAAHPVELYTPNMYLRIGIFILTLIIASFSFGLLCLMMLTGGGPEKFLGSLSIFFSMVAYFILEVLVREKKHYKSGADTALMYISGSMMITGIFVIGHTDNDVFLTWLIFAFSAWFTIRFTDMAMAWVAQLAFLFGIIRIFLWLKLIVPFLVIGLSFGMYYLLRQLLKEEKFRHYSTCFQGMQVLALLTLYVGGNYFVVNEVNKNLFDDHKGLPLGWIFWILTVAIPLVYLYVGLRTKDKIFVRTGLVLVAAIVFTIRYYHSLAPLEVAMTIGGLIMIGLAYGVIRYLKEPKHGFTSEEEEEKGTFEALQLESLVISQTMKAGPQPEKNFNFGGGTASGGGASGDY
jgi:hypothetical protein